MNPSMSRQDYYKAMDGLENAPASLKTLLAPFNVEGVPDQEDEFLMIGHVLDAISAEETDHLMIDAFAIMELALDLGLDA
jgi:hypothetical protein